MVRTRRSLALAAALAGGISCSATPAEPAAPGADVRTRLESLGYVP